MMSEKINKNPYLSLENFTLSVLKDKLLNDTISSEEKLLLINDFLSDYLQFNPITDKPVGKTGKIEDTIDFLLK